MEFLKALITLLGYLILNQFAIMMLRYTKRYYFSPREYYVGGVLELTQKLVMMVNIILWVIHIGLGLRLHNVTDIDVVILSILVAMIVFGYTFWMILKISIPSSIWYSIYHKNRNKKMMQELYTDSEKRILDRVFSSTSICTYVFYLYTITLIGNFIISI